MIIVYGLFIYSIYEFLKFLFLATLGDIITTIKSNYDSPEREQSHQTGSVDSCKEYYCFHHCLYIILKFKVHFGI